MATAGLVLAGLGALLSIAAGLVQWRSAPGPEGPTYAEVGRSGIVARRVAILATIGGVLTLAGIVLALVAEG